VEAASALEQALLALGCTPAGGEADYMIAGAARALRAAGRAVAAVDVTVTGTRASAEVSSACDAVAEGAAALDGDWLGLHDLAVDPAHRRRGLARATVAALLEWGVQQGASAAWLHVETGNSPARSLYEGLGFAVHHQMRYLTLPD
jgi:GNAT superfamily N-acetyltransferase